MSVSSSQRHPPRSAGPPDSPSRRNAPPIPTNPYLAEAGLVWIVTFTLGLLALGFFPPGLAWDEPFYVHYGNTHLRWFLTLRGSSFTREGIERYWKEGREHPPLFPLAIGVADLALGGGAWPEGTLPKAGRGAGVVELALLASAVYLFVAGRWGRWSGRATVVCLLALPRLFAQGQLAAGDLPMALTWFLTVWAFLRALERGGLADEVLAGIALGSALLTKMNALFLPLILIPWALAVKRSRSLRAVVVVMLVGVVVFFAGWPWLWLDPVAHLRDYLRTGTARAHIRLFYLGRSWEDVRVPWHYPFVMSAVTVPVGVLLAAAWGAVGGLRRDNERALTVLLLANILLPLTIFALPGVPVYDGVRLFLHVFPFVACLGGVGAVRVVGYLRRRGWRPGPAGGLTAALLLLQLVPTIATAPFGLSYYNALVGGPTGARRLGFESTYWGEAMDPVFWRQLGEVLPTGSRVAINFIPAEPIRPFYDGFIRRAGFLPVRYRPSLAGCDFLILVCRQGYFDRLQWDLYRRGSPVLERPLRWFAGSVPLCRVYDVREIGGPREAER